MLISAFSLLVAGGSLGWQVAQWLLSGGRPKATLIHGLVTTSGAAYSGPVTAKGSGFRLSNLRDQGISGVEVVGVQVTNHGRAPVVVEHVKLHPRGGTMAFEPVAERIGADLPYTLEAGTNATWFMDIEHAARLADMSRDVLKESVSGVYMTAQLGTGKTIKTNRTFRT